MLVCFDLLYQCLQVLGEESFAALIDTAVGAALISLRAVRLLHQAAGRFPRNAAPPTASAFSNLLPVLPHWAVSMLVCRGRPAQLWWHMAWQSA